MKILIKYKAIPCSEFSKEYGGIIEATEKDLEKFVVKCPNGSCSNGWINLSKEVLSFIDKGIGHYEGRVVCRARESEKKGALECSSEVVFTVLVSDTFA